MSEVRRLNGAAFNSDRSGVVTFKIPYEVPREEDLVTFSPGRGPLNLPVVEREAKEDSGDWILTLTFEGVPESSGGGSNRDSVIEEIYELDGSTSEDPIETHPDFDQLKKKYRALMDGDKLDGWAPSISVDGETKKNPMLGVSAFLNVGSVWRKTTGKRAFPDNLLRQLGCIDTPSGNKKPPNLPDGRNWLKRSIKATWRGNLWTVTEEWLGSGRGGWNRDIYKAK